MMPAYGTEATTRHSHHPQRHHHHHHAQQASSPHASGGGGNGGAPMVSGPLEYPVRFPVHPLPADLVVPADQAHLVPRPRDIAAKKYATSVDDRNFLTVYEYLVNGQWVIWDYYTGFVHLTGLWKAIGHSKADIVKLIDTSPELETVIRRVRGGFLKIQGTWLPFETAERLAARTCYHIRYALVPLFGPAFPSKCLQPHEQGFGQLQLREGDASPRRRKRSSTSTRSVAIANEDDQIHKRRRSENGAVGSVNMTSGPQYAAHRYSRSMGSASTGRPHLAPLEWHDRGRRYSTAATSSDDESDGSPRYLTLPPPMPQKLDIADHDWLLNSPDDFVQVLQASRSLQQISAGPHGRRWSHDHGSLGGGFEAGGKLWQWDGDRELHIVGTTTPQPLGSTGFRPIAPSPHDRRRTNSVPESGLKMDPFRRIPPTIVPQLSPAPLPGTRTNMTNRRSMDIQNILT